MQPLISMSAEALSVNMEHCLATLNAPLGLKAERIALDAGVPFNLRTYDAMLKLYVTVGQAWALDVFERMKDSEVRIGEGLCGTPLARAAESKFLAFAHVVVSYVRANMKMTVMLYSAFMKVYAYSGMYAAACDLYPQILAEGLEPDNMMYSCL